MQIFIAENLKYLRKARGNTQEDLARHIGITVQSVSKWERGEGYPDIELLPVIAEFYEVSADDLLGVGKAVREKRVKEFAERCEKADRTRRFTEELELCKEIYSDYPNNETVMRYYMNALRKNGYFEESLALTRKLLEKTEDYRTRYEALRNGIGCIAVSYNGNFEEAMSYVNKLPDYFATRNQQMLNVLPEEEVIQTAKDNIEELLLCLCSNIMGLQFNLHTDEKLKLWKKAVELIDFFCEDGDYGNLTGQMLRFKLFIAHDNALLGNRGEAISNLQACAELAIKYDNENAGKYSSFMLRGKEYGCGTGARAALFHQMDTWGGFDNFRNDESFKRILESVRTDEDYTEPLIAGGAMVYDIIGTITLECEAVKENADISNIGEYSGCDITGHYQTRIPNVHSVDKITAENGGGKITFAEYEDGNIVGAATVNKENWEIDFLAVKYDYKKKEDSIKNMIAYCTKYITCKGHKARIRVSPISYGVILPAKEIGYVRK